MSGPRCSVCFHPKAAEIDAALATGAGLVPTAKRFGLSKSAVARHRTNCLAPKLQAAAKITAPEAVHRAEVRRAKAIVSGEVQPAASDVLRLEGLLSRIARSLDRLEGAADAAAAEGQPSALAALSGPLHRGIEVAAKLQRIGEPTQPAAGTGFTLRIDLGDGTPAMTLTGAAALSAVVSDQHAMLEGDAEPIED